MILDGIGIYGMVWVCSVIFSLMGMAGMAFIYFWYKGRLDMDEDAARQMIQQNDEHPGEK